MADNHVWLRCCGCKKVTRLISFGSGDWGPWNGTDDFVAAHMVRACQGDKLFNPDAKEPFLELVTSEQAESEGWWGNGRSA